MECPPKGKVQEKVTLFLDSNMRSALRRKDLTFCIANVTRKNDQICISTLSIFYYYHRTSISQELI